MVSVKLFFLCIWYLVLVAKCGKVPFITPCKPDDGPCILKSAEEALPHVVGGDEKLGLAPLDPLIYREVVADSGELKLKLKDLKIEGIAKSRLINVERDLKKSNIKIELETPFTATGKYEAKGKITIIDILGDGDFFIKSDKMKIYAVVKIKEVTGSDGQIHWEASRRSVKLEPITKVTLRFDNLFGGDAAQAKPVQDFLDTSSNEMTTMFGTHIAVKICDDFINEFNKILKIVPKSELEKS